MPPVQPSNVQPPPASIVPVPPQLTPPQNLQESRILPTPPVDAKVLPGLPLEPPGKQSEWKPN